MIWGSSKHVNGREAAGDRGGVSRNRKGGPDDEEVMSAGFGDAPAPMAFDNVPT
jgi:hypothetical protein